MHRATTILTQDRILKIVPRNPGYIGWSLSQQFSITASQMVRLFDQDERQADGAVRWNALKAVLTRGFRNRGADKFTDSQWWIFSKKEARK